MSELKVKKSLLFCFIVWLTRGDYKIHDTKRDIVLSRKDKEVLIKIKDDEYLEMNEVGQDRYKVFLKHWLNFGVELLNDLRIEGNMLAKKNRGQRYLELRK